MIRVWIGSTGAAGVWSKPGYNTILAKGLLQGCLLSSSKKYDWMGKVNLDCGRPRGQAV